MHTPVTGRGGDKTRITTKAHVHVTWTKKQKSTSTQNMTSVIVTLGNSGQQKEEHMTRTEQTLAVAICYIT